MNGSNEFTGFLFAVHITEAEAWLRSSEAREKYIWQLVVEGVLMAFQRPGENPELTQDGLDYFAVQLKPHRQPLTA